MNEVSEIMKKSTLYKGGLHLSYAEYGDKKGYPILIQHGLIASIHPIQLSPDLYRSTGIWRLIAIRDARFC